jgi:hypothetical protein
VATLRDVADAIEEQSEEARDPEERVAARPANLGY